MRITIVLILLITMPAFATETRPNFAEWEIALTGEVKMISAYTEDAAGNVEKRPHVWK